MGNFVQKLSKASRRNKSLLCVGLDPDPSLMPTDDVADFNKAIIDATMHLVWAYKPNMAFYEALGIPGLKALEASISHIRANAPDVIILGDAKRGDIASTSKFYARALFDVWGFDAVTVNAYAGAESLTPFFEYSDRGVFIFCRSSNPGAKEFQDLHINNINSEEGKSVTLYRHVAEKSRQCNTSGNVGLVTGATYPTEIQELRDLCPGMPFLLPGVGAQGGDLESSVKAALDSDHHNLLVSSSRGVTYASNDKDKFENAARASATELRNAINRVLVQEGKGWSSN